MLPSTRKALASLTLLVAGTFHASAAFNNDAGVNAANAVPVLAPIAFVKFCMREPHECTYVKGYKAVDSLDELYSVNRRVNDSIVPRRKAAKTGIGTWVIGPPSGDCNDYAVTKRHELIVRGWSSSALLLSDVETGTGEPHLVLRVRTSAGDVVLDNLTDEVRPASATSYRWVKRQSPQNPNIWVRAGGDGI